ncbi:hypothetical protein P3T22_000349 [Paraburkholderia sp. GAS348]
MTMQSCAHTRRVPLFIAAYYDALALGMPTREAVLREVGAVFVKWTLDRT